MATCNSATARSACSATSSSGTTRRPDGNEDGYFYNAHTGGIENWYRQFTPEEMGGLGRGMIENTQKTFSLTTGFKGTFGEKLGLRGLAQPLAIQGADQLAADRRRKANDLYLGPQLGVDADSGLPIFDADPARLYTPLTRAEYDSITARTNYHPDRAATRWRSP